MEQLNKFGRSETPGITKTAVACCLQLAVAKAISTEEPVARHSYAVIPQVPVCGGEPGDGRSYYLRVQALAALAFGSILRQKSSARRNSILATPHDNDPSECALRADGESDPSSVLRAA